MDQTLLNNLLQPKSVAIVGASTQPGKIGYTVIENLLKGGYRGKDLPHQPNSFRNSWPAGFPKHSRRSGQC